MSKSPKSLSFQSRRHENPAAAALERKLSDRNAVKYCNVYFPVELHTRLLKHVSKEKVSLRELIRTVIENWLDDHAGDLEKIKRGEVEIPAVEDGRKPGVERGELQNVVVHLPRELHQKLKHVTVIRKLTMRGIIVGIMQEWAEAHCT